MVETETGSMFKGIIGGCLRNRMMMMMIVERISWSFLLCRRDDNSTPSFWQNFGSLLD